MSTKIRMILLGIAVLILLLVIAGVAYRASKKGHTEGDGSKQTETADAHGTATAPQGTGETPASHGSETASSHGSTAAPTETKEPSSSHGSTKEPANAKPADAHGSAPAGKTPAAGDTSRFSLGDFTAPARDEEVHYIKIEVELEFTGDLEKELTRRKNELRDAVTTIIMKLTIQRAKEDYIDRFLHQEIQNKLNEILGTSGTKNRIIRIYIPSFLVN
ncbi:MAG: flagellar basal body-associated FliL family protein [Candidatus Riflebacteria bacterium]|nr:flagellar basal body-associated FliL family protein [Candidatus Riflebacteria bacterium]